MSEDVKGSQAGTEAAPRRSRKASKETRRQQLIEATIDSLAKRGYAETTMADVAEGAGLSRGIVNFHFESKEKLLVATLQYMADEYAAHWMKAYEAAVPTAAARLFALVRADFDRKITTRRKLAAWCAFWGEAKSRPTYQAHCGARDARYQELFETLVAELTQEGGYGYDPKTLTIALCSMMEGLWWRLMMSDGFGRDDALKAAVAFVVAVFPKHMSPQGPIT